MSTAVQLDIAANTATWQGSFSDARWKILNDVVGVSDDAFYVTEWLTQLPGTVGLWWEIFAQRHWASVQYCTGKASPTATTASEGQLSLSLTCPTPPLRLRCLNR